MTVKARLSTFAAVMAAMVVLLAIGAGVAAACPSAGATTINGIGSSLQKVAQENVWGPGYHATCPEVTIRYEALGSGEGLRAWGAETGTPGTSERSGFQYIATDDAPTEAQVANMRSAGNEARITMIPVAQAAVSVILNPPTNCTITEIKNEELEQIFRHTLTNWREVTTRTERVAGACNVSIRRVVRLDRSGTTFQFKHYLWLINAAENIVGTRSWLRLQGAETPADNTVWPGEEEVGGLFIRGETNGGGAVVRAVRENADSIGYASITDSAGSAEARLVIVRVLNRTGPGGEYAEPLNGNESNCTSTVYKTRLGRGTGLTREAEITLSLIWVTIYGSDPNIGGSIAGAYPICTLTWDGAYLEYARAGFPAPIGATVRGYLSYLLETGQAGLAARHYAELPAAIKGAAQGIAAGIS